jgi:Zn-finger nucleic acid-binding protein
MTESRRGLLLIDQCPNCRGLWFDGTELERYARARRVYDDPPHVTTGRAGIELADGRACPRCVSEKLQQGAWRSIPMTLCPRCQGIFITLDALRAVRAKFGRAERPEFREPNTDDGTWDLIDFIFAESHDTPWSGPA